MPKNIFQQYLSDPEFLMIEKIWDKDFQKVNASQYTLGNGYVCCRGNYEEVPKGAQPGTFFSGVYDPTASKVSEIVNAPNPFDLRISIPKDEKLDISMMNVVSNERILDLRRGLLCRQTTFEDVNKNKYDYQSMRFISMDNLHIAVMQVALTPLDKGGTFTINSAIDAGVMNHGRLTEPDIRHFHIDEVTKEKNKINYLAVKTLAHEIIIAYASQMNILLKGKSMPAARRINTVTLAKGETVVITKFFSLYNSKYIEPSHIKHKTIKTLKYAVKHGIKKLFNDHAEAFDKRWEYCDISIEGDADAQHALRFNIYHLLIAAHPDVTNVSIGAKTLSGEGYRAHIFWETDILIQPFFNLNEPKTARNLIEYRYNRLSAARRIAQSHGYQGAMFPWESAETGFDETPLWGKGFDGKIHLIHTGKQEQHITADVFYGMISYFRATQDIEFMLEMGLELALEIARFWISRLEYNEKEKHYEITGIMGPDEFHENVNNSVYTNTMAAWNIKTALKLITTFRSQFPKRVNKLLKMRNWTPKESETWEELAEKIVIHFDKETNLIQQFDDYFSLKHFPQPGSNDYGLPEFPKDVEVCCLYETQFVKQADVVMLLHLLPELFDEKTALKNYQHYEKQTLHKSSMSAGVHSAVAARLNLQERAYHYFMVSANTDRFDIYGNTHAGVHAGALGATWETVVFGFCGIHISHEHLSISPKLPPAWRHVKLSLYFRGLLVHFTVCQCCLKLLAEPATDLQWLTKQKHRNKLKQLCIKVYGDMHRLKLNQEYEFEAPIKEEGEHYDMEELL